MLQDGEIGCLDGTTTDEDCDKIWTATLVVNRVRNVETGSAFRIAPVHQVAKIDYVAA